MIMYIIIVKELFWTTVRAPMKQVTPALRVGRRHRKEEAREGQQGNGRAESGAGDRDRRKAVPGTWDRRYRACRLDEGCRTRSGRLLPAVQVKGRPHRAGGEAGLQGYE